MALQASAIASDLWSAVGNELIIFSITLVCAFVIRGVYPAQPVGKKGSGKASSPIVRSKSAGEPNQATQHAVPHPPRASNVSTGARRAGSPQEDSKFASRGQRRCSLASSPSHIINEVVEGMKEHQNLKFMFRALTLYEELRLYLSAEKVSIHEAARQARHNPSEFYTTIVQCAVRAGRQHVVEVVLDDMIQQSIPRPLAFYESTMKQLAGQKQYQLALAVYDRLAADGLEPSAVTCSCLIGFAAEAGEYQRAIGFFEKLSSMTTPSIRAYMTVLRVHAKRQDWLGALSKLRDMQQKSVPLDSLALNIVLSTGIAADRLNEVAGLLKEADGHQPPFSDVVSYNTLIKGHAQRGDVDGALQAMDRMRDRRLRPNAITFNTAMDACVRATRGADAWKLLDEMRSTGLRPDKFTCSILVKGITHAPTCTTIQAALALLEEVDSSCDTTLRSTMYNSILEAASQIGEEHPDVLSAAFRQMRQHDVAPLVSTHRLLAKKLPSDK